MYAHAQFINIISLFLTIEICNGCKNIHVMQATKHLSMTTCNNVESVVDPLAQSLSNIAGLAA